TLTAPQVQRLFEDWLAPVLGPWPAVRRCTASAVCAVLAYAAHRLSSRADACARLTTAPDSDTLLGHLARRCPDPAAVDARLRAARTGRRRGAVPRGRWPVACDLTLIPYHGAGRSPIRRRSTAASPRAAPPTSTPRPRPTWSARASVSPSPWSASGAGPPRRR